MLPMLSFRIDDYERFSTSRTTVKFNTTRKKAICYRKTFFLGTKTQKRQRGTIMEQRGML